MTMTPHKKRIRHSFSQNIEAYHENSALQLRVAAHLATLVSQKLCYEPARILEIGCGTGHLTKLIAKAYPEAEFYVSDASQSMVASTCQTFSKGHYFVMDGELDCIRPSSFDLIVSSMTVQWFENTEGGLNKLKKLLKPSGQLFYAAPTAKSFARWRKIMHAQGHAHGLMLPQNLSGIIDEQIIHLACDDGRGFLRSLKDIGVATAKKDYVPLSSGAMRRALREFDAQVEKDIAWHIAYGQLNR